MRSDFSTTAELEALCDNAVAEGLQLEFKEKEDRTTANLSRVDKKQIAEAISSFANSDGGTVIFGIKTRRSGDGDVACELMPIADVDQFASNVRMVCSLNVSPRVPDVEVRSLALPHSTAGIVVCDVPRSDQRPHMSTAPGVHSYFRRSFQGNMPMTPAEVRDQILAVRDAILEPVLKFPAGGTYTGGHRWVSGRAAVIFSLKNIGQALCRNPFLRVSSDTSLVSHTATFDASLGAWKTNFPNGTFIHVDDKERCLSLGFNVAVRFDLLSDLFDSMATDFTESVLVLPGVETHILNTITDKTSLEEIGFDLRFGAENAPARSSTMTLNRRQIAIGVLSETAVRDFYVQNYGAWRADLLADFK